MEKKKFIRIINEEIAEFDFLNNKKKIQEEEAIKLLHDEIFQKKFIIDSILYIKEKISFDNSDAVVRNDPDVKDDDNHNDLQIDFNSDIIYEYNDKPIKFEISFIGNNINYSTDYTSTPSTYTYPGDFESWYTSIDWNDIEVSLFTVDGDDIDFIAYKKAPNKIKELFIRSYVEPIIEKYTEVGDIKQKAPQYTSF